jgi:hypothetical protein
LPSDYSVIITFKLAGRKQKIAYWIYHALTIHPQWKEFWLPSGVPLCSTRSAFFEDLRANVCYDFMMQYTKEKNTKITLNLYPDKPVC